MRTLTKIYIYVMIGLGVLATLGAFAGDEFDGYALWGGIAFVALGVIASRFVNITEKYEASAAAEAELARINDLVDKRLQERQ